MFGLETHTPQLSIGHFGGVRPITLTTRARLTVRLPLVRRSGKGTQTPGQIHLVESPFFVLAFLPLDTSSYAHPLALTGIAHQPLQNPPAIQSNNQQMPHMSS